MPTPDAEKQVHLRAKVGKLATTNVDIVTKTD